MSKGFIDKDFLDEIEGLKGFHRETVLGLGEDPTDLFVIPVKIKRTNPSARIPAYATKGSAGFDLEAQVYSPVYVAPGGFTTVPTGLAFEIPEGFEIQVRPRSGHGSQGILAMFGTIDTDYRGEVRITVYNHTSRPFVVESGMKLAQGVLAPLTRATFEETDRLSETDRGTNGFGSTGR